MNYQQLQCLLNEHNCRTLLYLYFPVIFKRNSITPPLTEKKEKKSKKSKTSQTRNSGCALQE